MRYVLDSSVALKWVLTEPDSAKALQLRDDFQAALHELFAPDIFTVEVAHALTRAERRKVLAAGQASALLAAIGVYDCLYVALAEREKCQLVTADTRLVNAIQPHFPFLVPLASLP